jgi:hypothetical protein
LRQEGSPCEAQPPGPTFVSFFTLAAYSWPDVACAQAYSTQKRQSSASEMNGPPADIASLGDEAFSSGFGLIARKGRIHLNLKADIGSNNAAIEKTLAAKALARLP